MENDIIAVDLSSKDLKKQLDSMLEDIPKDAVKKLVSTYYSYAAQQHVNDRKYEEIAKLEWLVDLHNLLG